MKYQIVSSLYKSSKKWNGLGKYRLGQIQPSLHVPPGLGEEHGMCCRCQIVHHTWPPECRKFWWGQAYVVGLICSRTPHPEWNRVNWHAKIWWVPVLSSSYVPATLSHTGTYAIASSCYISIFQCLVRWVKLKGLRWTALISRIPANGYPRVVALMLCT